IDRTEHWAEPARYKGQIKPAPGAVETRVVLRVGLAKAICSLNDPIGSQVIFADDRAPFQFSQVPQHSDPVSGRRTHNTPWTMRMPDGGTLWKQTILIDTAYPTGRRSRRLNNNRYLSRALPERTFESQFCLTRRLIRVPGIRLNERSHTVRRFRLRSWRGFF